MTTIAEALAAVRETAAAAKEARARKRDSNIPTLIMAYRGNELIAMATPAVIDRDTMLGVSSVMAQGLAPDVMAIAMETWKAMTLINPQTGRSWRPGEMQQVVDHYDGIENGWVSDALTFTVVNRAGDVRVAIMPYRMVAKNVVWGEFEAPDDTEVGGYVADELVAQMNGPTVGQIFAQMGEERAPGVTDEMELAMNDCLAIKAMMSGDLGPEFGNVEIALQAERGSDREAVIKQVLSEYGGRMR